MGLWTWCADLYTGYPVNNVGLFSFAFGWIQIASGMAIAIWQRMQMRAAAVGKHEVSESSSASSGRLVVLPVYFYLLWVLSAADFLQGIMSLIFPLNWDSPNSFLSSVGHSVGWAVYHVAIEGTAFLLMQQGAGVAATERAFKISVAWGAITLVTQFFVWLSAGDTISFVCQIGYEIVLLVFYTVLWLVPFSWLFRRPGLVHYSCFWAVMRMILLVSAFLRHFKVDLGFCFQDIGLVLFAFGKPLMAFKVLLDDSHYWCGLFEDDGDSAAGASLDPADDIGDGAMQLSSSSRRPTHGGQSPKSRGTSTPGSPRTSIRTPLIGTSFKRDAAKSLALGVDFMRGRVPMLNFAFLSLEAGRKLLGVGGSSRVFEGSYRGKPVAIKMAFGVELTPAEVISFLREATTLANLDHPNVVHIEGVCVRPPSICLVLEFCHFGSMSDVLHAPGAQPLGLLPAEGSPLGGYRESLRPQLAASESQRPLHESKQRAEPTASSHRLASSRATDTTGAGAAGSAAASGSEASRDGAAPSRSIPLTWLNRLLMALHCAQGVAFLHSQQPPLLHLDIKSHNFLLQWVDRDDEKRQQQRSSRDLRDQKDAPETHGDCGASFLVKLADLELSLTTREALSATAGVIAKRTRSAAVGASKSKFVVPETPNWTAPELLKGGVAKASAKADCYSLGSVLYELLTCRIPFAEYRAAVPGDKREQLVYAICEENYRPLIPQDTDVRFAQLIADLWDPFPENRPSADAVVDTLKRILLSTRQQQQLLLRQQRGEDGGSVSRRGGASGGAVSASQFGAPAPSHPITLQSHSRAVGGLGLGGQSGHGVGVGSGALGELKLGIGASSQLDAFIGSQFSAASPSSLADQSLTSTPAAGAIGIGVGAPSALRSGTGAAPAAGSASVGSALFAATPPGPGARDADFSPIAHHGGLPRQGDSAPATAAIAVPLRAAPSSDRQSNGDLSVSN